MTIQQLRGRRILVVEDESLILLTIEDILDDLGCELAGTATRPEDAIALIGGRAIDAALLDVNLGGGRTSYPVADALAARGIPFAFVTGYSAETVLQNHRAPVLAKPVDEAIIAEVLLRLLENRPAVDG